MNAPTALERSLIYSELIFGMAERPLLSEHFDGAGADHAPGSAVIDGSVARHEGRDDAADRLAR